MNFDGIFPPAITPYQADGEIDKAAFLEVIEHLVASGVHGIVIGGSTGEYYAQTVQERYNLAFWAKDVIGSRTSLIVGTGAIRTEEAIEYAKAAKEIKADAIMVGSSPYALPNEAENAEHALRIDQAAGLPIMLYNYPARMGVSMGRDYFKAITNSSSHFKAIKEASGDTSQLHMLACEFPSIKLSCGWDDQALEFFAWGAQSWVCAGSNFLPKEHIALYEACVLEKNFEKGRKIMQAMMPLMTFLDQSGRFIQAIKYGCTMAGLRAGGVRAPLQPLNEIEKMTLKTIIDTAKTKIKSIIL